MATTLEIKNLLFREDSREAAVGGLLGYLFIRRWYRLWYRIYIDSIV
jgi:hypothetical protein